MSASLDCPICLSALHGAVTTNCGHSFCSGCLLGLLESPATGARLCPMCRAPLSQATPTYSLRAISDRHGPASDAAARRTDERLARIFAGEQPARPAAAGFFSFAWLDLLRQPLGYRTLKAWAIVAVAVFYLCSPVDLIPDWHFGPVGFLDDLFVVAWMLYLLHETWKETDNDNQR